MIPTVENFAELLREEVHTLRVMYRIGEMHQGYTAWSGWVEGDIEHAPDDENPGSELEDCGFRAIGDDDRRCWSYCKRNTDIEDSYEHPFEGFVFEGCDLSHHGEQCIQIVFMDTFNKTPRRITRNIKAAE